MTVPPRLALHLLGPPTVIVNGGPAPADVLWRKHLALLAYLALSPHLTRSRPHLQALLWPEKDTAHARHSLNEAVRRLRAGLGMARVRSQGDAVALDGHGMTIDVLEPAAVETDGELLEGFSLSDAAAFDDWLAAERVALRRRRVAFRVARASESLAEQRFAAALEEAHRALTADPLAEQAVAAAMRAAALMGDRTGAVRVYRQFAERLAAEIGAQPGQELAALARRIEEGTWRAASRPARPKPPLVGRAAIHTSVFRLLHEALGGRPTVLGVAGGTGLGKSRLLDEIADRWRLEGGTAVTARPVDQDQAVAWSTLRELFRRGLASAPGLPAAAPEALATLAGVVPDLPTPLEPRVPRDVAEAGTALRSVLCALAEEAPLALLLDGADAVDGHTLGAVQAALADVRDLPLLTVLARGPAPQSESPLTDIMARIGRELPGMAVTLSPLSPADTRALVEALATWCPAATQRARLARRLHFETGGSPLLLITLLRGLADIDSLREDALEWPPPRETLGAPVPDGVPHLAQLVTMARVRQLNASSRTFLTAACVGGLVVDPAITQAVASLSDREADEALTDLEQREFLAFDGARYVFPAPLIARTIVAVILTPGERHRLEERRAALLNAADVG
jgi:DNA-binding SARP family transcriptional activator